MKKLKLLSVVAFCLITALLLSSCGTTKNNDFSKQKYTNFKKGESALNIKTINKARKDAALNSAAYDKIEIAQTATVVGDKSPQIAVTSEPKIKKESEKTSRLANIILKESKKIKNSNAISTVKKSFEKKGNTTSVNDDGYSIFWLVVLILLILWLLGWLVADLGGFVHVLLVIALILLILWLLHVI